MKRLIDAVDLVPESMEDARRRIEATIVLRQGQGAFRDSLLEAYGCRCAISGCDVPEALEAAHIIPYKGEHTNVVVNGLLLRADLHTLFDLGLIAIDTADLLVLLHPRACRQLIQNTMQTMVTAARNVLASLS